MSRSPLLITVEQSVGRIVLNRPQALNAINREMVLEISKTLDQWSQDSAVQCVVLQGAGDKAFSAGGDLRQLYYAHYEGHQEEVLRLFRYEYQLNDKIHRFPKPYITFFHGFGMGGGLGLSLHGSYRIVCEGTQLAMPEVNIGFFPDVGASYFLNQCPGSLGMYLALTGNRVSAADAIYTGLATHYINQKDYDAIYRDLTNQKIISKASVETILKNYNCSIPPSALQNQQLDIDHLFGQDTLENIIAALHQESMTSIFARTCLEILQTKSPTSLKVTFAMMQKARDKPLYETLQMDFLLAQKFCLGSDFFEGIRAVIIDKDNQPDWQPKRLEDISEYVIEEYFNADSYLNLFNKA
ncbi:MAG: enoyl-CoA hydratase/isomerase family protein [Janthinobacterium lividum]